MPIENFTASQIAAMIPDAHRDGAGWRAPCIAHGGDNKDALHIFDDPSGKGAVVQCFTNKCSVAEIIKALGIDTKRRTSGHGAKKSVYDYHDEHGTLVHQTVIERFPDGSKKCTQRQPDPAKPGAFIKNLKGVTRVLFHLPQLIKAVSDNQPILIVEGEECVLTAERLGYAATTNAMGAGKWRASYNDYLKGADVVILPDADDAGKKHAKQVHEALGGIASSIKIVCLPGLSEKGDIVDWIKAGGTREQLDELIAGALAGDSVSDDTNENDDFPTIVITNRHMRDIAKDAISAINTANDPPTLFQYGRLWVRVEENETEIETLDSTSLNRNT